MSRWLIDPPLPGPVNMARDEALLEQCVDVDAPPIVRFYAWSSPTISLGYFQDFSEFEMLAPPAGNLAVVRRCTGGGAILHDLEVTYSITMPLAHPLIAGRPNRLYELAHDAIIAAIGHGTHQLGGNSGACDSSAQRGPFFCFARRHMYDVVVDDPAFSDNPAKIAGSAQRRTRTAVLQHGSIILDSRFPQQPTATWSSLAGPITFDKAVEKLILAFSKNLELNIQRDDWHPEELQAAHHIEPQYAGDLWTRHRTR